MQIANEIIAITFVKRHERPAHYDELHLINIMPDLAQLLHAITSLDIGIVPCSYRTHRGWLIASVRLCRILKI